MAYQATFKKRTFHFDFDARTSRGQMRERVSWFLTISNDSGTSGIGEIAPLAGLSKETPEEVELALNQLVTKINEGILQGDDMKSLKAISERFYGLPSSVMCGLEMALLDMDHGGKKLLFQNGFASRESGIPTNGLIWIGGMDAMLQQLSIKVEEGFRTLKIKIGSLDFEKEIDILQYIRRKYFRENITIRLDANGAFKPGDALYKLNELAKWNIHSVEQPIMPGNQDVMREVCAKSPIPIALDEELIGNTSEEEKMALLDFIRPQFLILKPSLMGGFYSSARWIELAEARNIGWWITSALESSIGLNAVAQFTAQHAVTMPQGLGTGKIFSDNIISPLEIKNGMLLLDPKGKWEDEILAEGGMQW